MDNINITPQTQNPEAGVPSGSQPNGPAPLMPSTPMKKRNLWFWIVLVLIAFAGFGAWWYIGQQAPEPVVQAPQTQNDQDAHQDAVTNNAINSVNLGDVNNEFKFSESDVNGL